MGRFTEKQLTIMTIVVAVVITGLFAALIYQDLQSMDEEEQQIAGLEVEIQGAKREQARIPALETEVIVFREIVMRDSAVLPDESEINKFINIIGEFERFSGVVVTQVQGLSTGRTGKGKEAILKIPLKLKLRGSIDQFLKFINSFESYERFVSVTGFTIAGGKSVDENGNSQHEISLQLETYQYDPKGGSVERRVEIPNYERRKQELAIQKAIRSSKPAHIEKYLLKPRMSRRDPLMDPREAETPEKEGVSKEEQYVIEKAIVEKLILDVSLLHDDVRIEEKLRADNQYMRLPPICRAIDQRIAQLDFQINQLLSSKDLTIPELKNQFIKDVVQAYETIKEGRKTSNTTQILVERKQVFDTLQKMREEFDGGEYRNVIQLYEGFLRGTEGRMVFAPDAEPLKADMEVVTQQALVITKFENEPLRIGGVIIDPKKTSFAIINELIVAEGDFVDSDRKILIREIRADTIVFEYEGVQIPKFIRNK